MLTLQLRQPLLPWWATHCWPVIGLRHRALLVQVIQDFLDGDRIFYGGNDLDGAAAGIAGLCRTIDQRGMIQHWGRRWRI